MSGPRVYADFNNADPKGRLRLTCVGTINDLSRLGVQLREGLVLTVYMDDADHQGQPDDMEAVGVVEYSPDEHCWVARIDWEAIRHASDARHEGNGVGVETPVRLPETT